MAFDMDKRWLMNMGKDPKMAKPKAIPIKMGANNFV
jgi:hypothetical protein